MASVIRVDKVTPSSQGNTAPVFSEPGGGSQIGTVTKGQNVQVLADSGSMTNIQYNSQSAWMRSSDLSKGASSPSNSNSSSSRSSGRGASRDGEGNTSSSSSGMYQVLTTDSNSKYGGTKHVTSETYRAANDEEYEYAVNKYNRALGSPPHFNMDIDIQYNDLGRVQWETLGSNPSILSICPGKVDFLPGWNKKEKDNFIQSVTAAATGDAAAAINNDKANLTGKLYTFKEAYTDYVNILNALCRTAALMLGIGDIKMPGNGVPLKNFDYGYWVKKPMFKNTITEGGIFNKFWEGAKETLRTINSDSIYLHYFVMNGETEYSESASTQTETSAIEDAVNNSSLSSLAKNLNYLFGGPVGGTAVEGIWKDLGGSHLFAGDGFLSRIGNAAMNYLNGARMVIPDMLGDVQWSKTIRCSMTFISPYGDPEAVFYSCIVPILSLLTFAYPKQISENMYTYPFIVRVYEQGWFNSDLAIINDITVSRGGSDDTAWTWDGLATEWNVSFNVTPLYNELMVTSSENPLLFFGNDSLLQYLGNLCGLDLKTDNLSTKIKLAMNLLQNKHFDTPKSVGRRVGEFIGQKLTGLFQFQA